MKQQHIEKAWTHYTQNVLKSMAFLEERSGLMMHELNREVHDLYWDAYDKRDLSKIRFISAQFDKLVDKYSKGEK